MTISVVAALLERRAELLREAKAAETALSHILDAIEHIDGAISTFDADYRPAKARRRRLPHYSRSALAVLRDAKEPMPIRDIAVRVLADQGRDVRDAKAVSKMIGHTRSALSRYRSAGTVRSLPGEGQVVLWEVVR